MGWAVVEEGEAEGEMAVLMRVRVKKAKVKKVKKRSRRSQGRLARPGGCRWSWGWKNMSFVLVPPFIFLSPRERERGGQRESFALLPLRLGGK